MRSWRWPLALCLALGGRSSTGVAQSAEVRGAVNDVLSAWRDVGTAIALQLRNNDNAVRSGSSATFTVSKTQFATSNVRLKRLIDLLSTDAAYRDLIPELERLYGPDTTPAGFLSLNSSTAASCPREDAAAQISMSDIARRASAVSCVQIVLSQQLLAMEMTLTSVLTRVRLIELRRQVLSLGGELAGWSSTFGAMATQLHKIDTSLKEQRDSLSQIASMLNAHASTSAPGSCPVCPEISAKPPGTKTVTLTDTVRIRDTIIIRTHQIDTVTQTVIVREPTAPQHHRTLRQTIIAGVGALITGIGIGWIIAK